jgi:hypothetical protein
VSGQDKPYVRVYYSVADDERFANVYPDSRILGDWLKLLLGADACYPATAPLPYGIRKASLTVLTDSGLIAVANGRYSVHGLKAERDGRSEAARESAEARWSRQYGSASAVPPQYDRNAPASGLAMLAEPSLAEPNQTEPSQAITAPEDGPDVWYFVVGRYPNRRDSQALYDWLTRLCEDFGVVRLWEVMRMCYAQERNKATLLSRTEAVLSRDAARLEAQERDAERAKVSAQRAPVKPLLDPAICIRCGEGSAPDNPLVTGGAFGSYHQDKCAGTPSSGSRLVMEAAK